MAVALPMPTTFNLGRRAHLVARSVTSNTVPLCRVHHRDLHRGSDDRPDKALPVHELRAAMMSRTQAATGSASIMHSIAAPAVCPRWKVPAGQRGVSPAAAQISKSAIRGR
jgi:hypothetical protein